MKVNPSLLQKPSNGMQNGPQRNNGTSMLALIKAGVTSAIEKMFDSKVLNVKMQNGEALEASLEKTVAALQQLLEAQRNLQVGKASLTTQAISEFRVSNLEELKLENVEKLAFTLEQLDPIIKALQKGNTLDQQSVTLLDRVVKSLMSLSNAIKGLEPKDFPVEEITSRLEQIYKAISSLRLEVPKPQEIKFPQMPKNVGLLEGKAILRALESVNKKLDALPKSFPEIQIPKSVEVTNFPPQKYPMPVTNININPLRGFVKSRAVTVTTSLTPLPEEVLAYRRALVVYNNSSSTIFVGGSDVNTTNGMPVPASSYSPAFDAGPNMIVYAVVASGSANVRVLELSNENIGG